jgi:hypothetical protein
MQHLSSGLRKITHCIEEIVDVIGAIVPMRRNPNSGRFAAGDNALLAQPSQ